MFLITLWFFILVAVNSLYWLRVLQISSSLHLSFHFLRMSFDEQNFLIEMLNLIL